MELSTKQKIEAALRDNPNARTIMAWIQYEEKETIYQLKKIPKDSDFRYAQGKIAVLDELIDLLTKAIS